MTTKNYILHQLRVHKGEFLNMGIKSVGLFGSYTRNEQLGSSVIDFELGRATLTILWFFCEIIESLFKDEKVEVVTMDSLSPYIGFQF